MVEQVAGSKGWRETVAATVLRRLGAVPGPTGPVAWWTPWEGAVAVRLRVWLPRPVTGRGATSPWPIAKTDGDLDKLERNIGDALTDTAVIRDDTQIVHWDAWKAWAVDHGRVGCLVEVGKLDLTPVDAHPAGGGPS